MRLLSTIPFAAVAVRACVAQGRMRSFDFRTERFSINRRVALLIGNSGYTPNLFLKNPVMMHVPWLGRFGALIFRLLNLRMQTFNQ